MIGDGRAVGVSQPERSKRSSSSRGTGVQVEHLVERHGAAGRVSLLRPAKTSWRPSRGSVPASRWPLQAALGDVGVQRQHQLVGTEAVRPAPHRAGADPALGGGARARGRPSAPGAGGHAAARSTSSWVTRSGQPRSCGVAALQVTRPGGLGLAVGTDSGGDRPHQQRSRVIKHSPRYHGASLWVSELRWSQQLP